MVDFAAATAGSRQVESLAGRRRMAESVAADCRGSTFADPTYRPSDDDFGKFMNSCPGNFEGGHLLTNSGAPVL